MSTGTDRATLEQAVGELKALVPEEPVAMGVG
jgi:hypothetical protein